MKMTNAHRTIDTSLVSDFVDLCFDDWHPGEVLEVFASDITCRAASLAFALGVDSSDIALPLSPSVVGYVRSALELFMSPADARSEYDPDAVWRHRALTEEEIACAARMIQDAIIPAV